jgi:hypothetical protein
LSRFSFGNFSLEFIEHCRQSLLGNGVERLLDQTFDLFNLALKFCDVGPACKARVLSVTDKSGGPGGDIDS